MSGPSSPAARQRFRRPAPGRQRGAAQLFITIVLLIVIMMLGVTATILSSTQFKLAGNLQFENVAFNNAEAAAATALGWLKTGNNAKGAGFTTYNSGSTPHLYPTPLPSSVCPSSGDLSNCPAGFPFAATWSDTNSLVISTSQSYVIQKLTTSQDATSTLPTTAGNLGDTCSSPIQTADVFRVTARGSAGRGTVKFIQSVVATPSVICAP